MAIAGVPAIAVPSPATAKPGPRQTADERTSKARPNVLQIVMDDMRADDLRRRVMPQTMRLIADRGTTFTSAYANTPLCSPARASLLTGRYTHNHGGWTLNDGWKQFQQSGAESQTLAVWLRGSGYYTGLLGKYLNNYAETNDGHPTRYVPAGWDDWRAANRGLYNYGNTLLNHNGEIDRQLVGRYQSTGYGEIGTEMIADAKQSGRPWFLSINFTAPHDGTGPTSCPRRPDQVQSGPWTPCWIRGKFRSIPLPARGHKAIERDLSDKRLYDNSTPLKDRALRRAAADHQRRLEALFLAGRAIGRLVRKLRSSGELANTYVILTSDNGYMLGENGIEWGKVKGYNPSVRIPLIVRGPHVRRGVTNQTPFATVDMAPTIARLARLKRRLPSDGVSRSAAVHGQLNRWDRPVFYEAVGSRSHRSSATWLGARTRRFSLLRFGPRIGGPAREFYFLPRDPYEKQSVERPRVHRHTRLALERRIKQFRRCSWRSCRRISLPGGS